MYESFFFLQQVQMVGQARWPSELQNGARTDKFLVPSVQIKLLIIIKA